jgi:hypothetical protein
MVNIKMLRSFTLFFGLQLITLLGVAGAAEDASTCRFWNTLDEPRKTFYVLGYADGAHTMAVYVNVILERKRIDHEAELKMAEKMVWPSGHRVGSVLIELNLFCKDTANANTELRYAFPKIASQIIDRTK